MNGLMYNMLANDQIGGFWAIIPIIKIVLLVVMAICALFIIFVVLIQPGNSSGISALGGTSETFFEKNKGKTFESKMKKLTTVCYIILAVLSIVFYILLLLQK
ncbi:MAG: preprotein translocase subunit SecG [Clostridiales bacterium]|nr:preprotein translocase subunit SecG [Clostridiales bacterium]